MMCPILKTACVFEICLRRSRSSLVQPNNERRTETEKADFKHLPLLVSSEKLHNKNYPTTSTDPLSTFSGQYHLATLLVVGTGYYGRRPMLNLLTSTSLLAILAVWYDVMGPIDMILVAFSCVVGAISTLVYLLMTLRKMRRPADEESVEPKTA